MNRVWPISRSLTAAIASITMVMCGIVPTAMADGSETNIGVYNGTISTMDSQPAMSDNNNVDLQDVEASANSAVSKVTGVSLGTGTTVHAKLYVDQQSVRNLALQQVIKWRKDALNDSRIKFSYRDDNGKRVYVPVAEYLQRIKMTQQEYLSPKWSNALERIALQRTIEAYSFADAHTRPNGESCFTATYDGMSSNGEILAWGSDSITAAIDLWASEKADYIDLLNGKSAGETGHYTQLVDPSLTYYGFGAGDGMEYPTTYARETGSSWYSDQYSDSSAINLKGTYDFEVNVDADKFQEGVTWSIPSSVKSGTRVSASVKLVHYENRYELSGGAWTSSDTDVASIDSNGVITAKKPGSATITTVAGGRSFSKQITVTPVTLTYNGNGATSGSVASSSGTAGTSMTVAENGFTRRAYTFTQWNTAANGTGKSYAPGSRISISADIVLYAQWKANPRLSRLAGATRYDTMSEIAKAENMQKGQTVIVASGDNYPDALAASGLAGALDATIILTGSQSLSKQAASSLSTLQPKRIIIAGGPVAVSKKVESSLHHYSSTVKRYYGSDRYATSLALYKAGKELGAKWDSTTVMLMTGDNYADALSASSYAYATKRPVFLCSTANGFSKSQLEAMKVFRQQIVIGGESAVPEWIVTKQLMKLPAVGHRVAGATRYETSIEVAKEASTTLGINGTVFATGTNFPDALAAGPLAGRNRGFLLLADPSDSTAEFVDQYVKQHGGSAKSAYVVGGENAISRSTANQLADALNMTRL